MAFHELLQHGPLGLKGASSSSVSHESAALPCLSCRTTSAACAHGCSTRLKFRARTLSRSSSVDFTLLAKLPLAAPQNRGSSHFFSGVEKRMCVTRASHAGTDDGLSSERPGWQNKVPSFPEKTIDAVKIFPWGKVCERFVERVLDLAWIATKWLAIPVFTLSTLAELVYTLSARKDIFIPLGILSGVLLAKVIGSASLDVVKELEDGRTSWPLIVLGIFFVLLKLPGPYYPSWGAAFLPHVANAGLVQTALLFRESRRISM